jgi:flagellar assembly protein FliH
MLLIKNGSHVPLYTPLVLRSAEELIMEKLAGVQATSQPLPKPELQSESLTEELTSESASLDALSSLPITPALYDIAALEHEALTIITTAETAAEAIVADARRRAGNIEQAAYEKALIEARATAQAEVTATVAEAVEPLRAELSASLNELTTLREEMTLRIEQELVTLAMEIAKKIVQREVMVDREVVISLIRVTIARLNANTMAVVRLHTDDYQYVSAHRDRLSGMAVELKEDPTISRGGCLVESGLGDVDARIEQQFAMVEHGFLGI